MEDFVKAINKYFNNIDKEIIRKTENNEKLNEYENMYVRTMMYFIKEKKDVRFKYKNKIR